MPWAATGFTNITPLHTGHIEGLVLLDSQDAAATLKEGQGKWAVGDAYHRARVESCGRGRGNKTSLREHSPRIEETAESSRVASSTAKDLGSYD